MQKALEMYTEICTIIFLLEGLRLERSSLKGSASVKREGSKDGIDDDWLCTWFVGINELSARKEPKRRPR